MSFFVELKIQFSFCSKYFFATNPRFVAIERSVCGNNAVHAEVKYVFVQTPLQNSTIEIPRGIAGETYWQSTIIYTKVNIH